MSGRYISASIAFIRRDTEPLRRTSREHYPEAFRMTQKDIDDAPMVPSIPPLLVEGKR